MSSSTTVSKLALWLSYAFAAVLVLLPFHALLTTWLGSNFHHLDLFRIWKEILACVSLPFAGFIIYKDANLQRWFLDSWIVRLFGAYVLLHLILGIWAQSQHHVNSSALIYSLMINLRFVGFFIICAILAAKSDFLIKNWRKILIWPALVVIVFGILQIIVLPHDFLRHFGYGASTIPAYQTVDSNHDYIRAQSTLRGANPLGAYLVLIIPALLLMSFKSRALKVGVLLGAFLVLFYTYSRSAWLGLVASLIALGGLSGKIKIKKNMVAGLILVALILLAVTMQLLRSNQAAQDTILHTSSSSSVDVTSNEARLVAIKQGLSDVEHQPLGDGPGTAGPASSRNTGHQPRIAENYFLQIGQEVGVLGMAIIIGIILLVARELWQRRDDELAKILLVSLIGLTVVNLISHAWTDDTLAYLWWGLAGVICTPALVKPKR